MFTDYILESGITPNMTIISEETQREVDNIEVADFSESSLSPIELAERSIYEFVQENMKTMNVIAAAEMKYIRENGEEPIWEASDHESFGKRISEAVSKLIAKVTGFFHKIMNKIDETIHGVYKKINMKQQNLVNALKGERAKKILNKEINMRRYDPSIGKEILSANGEPKAIMMSVPALKIALSMIEGQSAEVDEKSTLRDKLSNEDKKVTKQLMKKMFGKLGISEDDAGSISDVKTKLMNIMSPEKVKLKYDEINKELTTVMNDPNAVVLKKEVKDLYSEIRKSLTKLKENLRSYKKNTKGSGRGSIPSNVAGLFGSAVNTYGSAMAMVYTNTTHVITKRWFQAFSLAVRIAISAKKASFGKDKKDN